MGIAKYLGRFFIVTTVMVGMFGVFIQDAPAPHLTTADGLMPTTKYWTEDEYETLGVAITHTKEADFKNVISVLVDMTRDRENGYELTAREDILLNVLAACVRQECQILEDREGYRYISPTY